IGQVDLAFPLRLDGADLGDGDRRERGVGGLLERLAARDRGLEHLGIVELFPYGLARRRELDLAGHGHRPRVLSWSIRELPRGSRVAASFIYIETGRTRVIKYEARIAGAIGPHGG